MITSVDIMEFKSDTFHLFRDFLIGALFCILKDNTQVVRPSSIPIWRSSAYANLHWIVVLWALLSLPTEGSAQSIPPVDSAGDSTSSADQISPDEVSGKLNDRSSDPLPPDVIDVVLGEADAGGVVAIEVTVKPSASASVEVVWPDHPKLRRVGDGAKPAAILLTKGAPATAKRTEHLQFDKSDGKPVRLLFEAVLRNAEGEVFARVTKVVSANQVEAAVDPSAERVPVVFTTPSGRRIVEYMSRDEAQTRGLTVATPAPSSPGAGVVELINPEQEKAK
ncbi:MAG: hypothetical protein ACI9R3_004498 [Verrucomicrobiales bacterium]|jgi:hypothetical protein